MFRTYTPIIRSTRCLVAAYAAQQIRKFTIFSYKLKGRSPSKTSTQFYKSKDPPPKPESHNMTIAEPTP